MTSQPAPNQVLAGTRWNEHWTADLLDWADEPVGSLGEITAGSLTMNINAPLRRTGSITYHGESVAWSRYRVRPVYHWTGVDGETRSWPMGVLIPDTTGVEYTDGGETRTIDLYDKIDILSQDAFAGPYTVPEGVNIVGAVEAVISAGDPTSLHGIEPAADVMRSPRVWEPGTTRLRVINDLLESINYAALYTDDDGVYRASPYRAPGDRPDVHVFADDEYSIYRPEFTHEKDTYEAANRVVAIVQGDDEKPGLRAVAENRDPGSMISYQHRGRWVTRVEEGVEAANQTVLQAYADRLIQEEKTAVSKFSISHAPIRFELGDMVGFARDAAGIRTRGSIDSVEYSFEAGALCQTVIREVIS